jgi:hypothetical protein
MVRVEGVLREFACWLAGNARDRVHRATVTLQQDYRPVRSGDGGALGHRQA